MHPTRDTRTETLCSATQTHAPHARHQNRNTLLSNTNACTPRATPEPKHFAQQHKRMHPTRDTTTETLCSATQTHAPHARHHNRNTLLSNANACTPRATPQPKHLAQQRKRMHPMRDTTTETPCSATHTHAPHA